jgi:predicted 3-demethylubiquinone-9 3-methyltransferase (glyoxalase superfamily)
VAKRLGLDTAGGATPSLTMPNNSKVSAVTHYGDTGPGPKDSVMTAAFELDGQPFVALNGGPLFPFTEAVSFVVDCVDQAEVDAMWEKLAAGGKPGQCGWLKDKFGLSWQIVPRGLTELVAGPDPVKAKRAMEAMLGMGKLDIGKLRRAYEGA